MSSTNLEAGTGGAGTWYHALLTGFWDRLEAYARRRSRIDRIERLEALSDAELAAMGLTRGQIARHVYADLYYI